MPGPSTPVLASAPIPPPTAALALVDSNGRLTPWGLEFMQWLWASIQGQGGILDGLLETMPAYGQVAGVAESVLAQDVRAESAVQGLRGQMAALRRLVDDAYALASAPRFSSAVPASASAAGTSVVLLASETIAAGAIISMWDNSGVANWRNADVTDDSKPADAFALVPGSSGAPLTGYLAGQVNNAVSGLTPGGLCFLAATGGITQTRPVSGWLQIIGKAADATHMVFQPGQGDLL